VAYGCHRDGLSQPSHRTVKLHRAWVPYLHTRLTRTCEAGLRRNQAQTEAWPDKCICGEPHTLIFTTRTGHPIEPGGLNRRFEYRCKRAGVRRITIHDTRRTCGSRLAALDVHPRVAMAILRHSKIALTMEIYTQVPDRATREALKRLSDQLGQAPGT